MTEAVPATRRGAPGIHLHILQAATDWIRGRATTAATSAQYPHPVNANRIDTATETILETTSMAEVTEKRRARFRRATCTTEVLLKNMVTATQAATRATRGSP